MYAAVNLKKYNLNGLKINFPKRLFSKFRLKMKFIVSKWPSFFFNNENEKKNEKMENFYKEKNEAHIHY